MAALAELIQRGIACYQQGQAAEAEALARQVLAVDDGQPDALQLLGLVAFEAGYTEQGLTLMQGAITNQPDRPSFYINLGRSLLSLGRLEEALEQFEAALALDGTQVIALTMAGVIYQEQHRPERALEVLQRALQLQPDAVEIRYNLAVALQKQEQFKESLHALSQVLQAQPKHLDALNLRGLVRQETGQLDKAQADFESVLSQDPGHAEAHLNLGTLKILRNQLPQGWNEYEWRWDCPSTAPASYGAPRWQGQPLAADQRLLVFADAGFGDTLQFIRYVLTDPAPREQITFRCQAALLRLFAAQDWNLPLLSDKEPVPAGYAYEFPLLSYPCLRQTTVDSIPLPQPYLRAPATGPRLPEAAAAARKRIGFVWAGSPDNAINLKRSCKLERFLELARAHPDIAWISLQKGPATADLTELPDNVWNFDAEIQDFADTAYLISQLDGVISVDTSVVHLAAAMGCPTWVLLPMIPDWRWFLERPDSPWYENVRLFRQPERHGWKQAFRQVAKALAQI